MNVLLSSLNLKRSACPKGREKFKSGNAWITIMNNINVVAVASLADVSCVIFAEGTDVPDEVIKRAEAQGINLLRSELPAYELCGRIYKLCDE